MIREMSEPRRNLKRKLVVMKTSLNFLNEKFAEMKQAGSTAQKENAALRDEHVDLRK